MMNRCARAVTVAVAVAVVFGFGRAPGAFGQLRFGGPTNSSDLYNSMPAWSGSNWLGSTLSPNQDWRLGVQVDNLDTGVFVRQVAPNSAAARANIEVNDVIIAVAGQQVGIVDNRPFDLANEIKRRADASGNVTLLVQDGSSGRLATIRVKLDSSHGSLRGQVVVRERYQLPQDALVSVAIENLSRPNFVVRNGETVFNWTGQNAMPFEIAYDPSYIVSSDVYQLRARVTSSGRVLLDTLQPVRVLGNYPSENVQLVVAPIQGGDFAGGLASSSPGSLPNFSSVVSAGYGGSDPTLAKMRQIYLRYLGRVPTDLEIAAFSVSPTASYDIEALPINLMASQNYYDAHGNSESYWLASVFQNVIGRPPTPQESEQWLRYFKQLRGSRVELLRQLLKSK